MSTNAAIANPQGRGEVALRVAAWRRNIDAFISDDDDEDANALWSETDGVLFQALCEARPTTDLEAAAQLEAILIWAQGSLLSSQDYDVTAIRNVITYLRRGEAEKRAT